MPSMWLQKVSPSRIRKTNILDYDLICCQLNKAHDAIPDKEVGRGSNAHETTTRIVNQEVDSIILDEAYLLVYNVGEPWYANKTYVQELLVLKLRDGKSFSVIPDMLDDLMYLHQADAIIVGGALTPRAAALSRLYRRHGFVLEDSPTLIKRKADG